MLEYADYEFNKLRSVFKLMGNYLDMFLKLEVILYEFNYVILIYFIYQH